MYKLIRDEKFGINAVQRLSDNAFIPFDPANTDYQKFKVDCASGVPLEDLEGNAMTQSEVNTFLETIP